MCSQTEGGCGGKGEASFLHWKSLEREEAGIVDGGRVREG